MPSELLATRRIVGLLAICALTCLEISILHAAEPAAQHAGLRKFPLTYRSKVVEKEVERPVYLWYPTSEEAPEFNYRGQVGFVKEDAVLADGKHPLIIFSHGFMGTADQTIFLTEELARQGYIVAALDHADSLRSKRDKPLEMPNFADAKSWDDSKFRDRREDVVNLLNYLLKLNAERDSFLFGHVDKTKIGAAGHSLGGYTILGTIGGWPKWEDNRIRAALLMSPYAAPFLTQGEVAKVNVPVMLQGGGWDFGITPFLPSLYDRMNSPRYYVVFKNETHFGWTNLASLGKSTKDCISGGNPELIARYSVAFFDRTLVAEDRPDLTADEPRLDTLKFEEHGGKSNGNARPIMERRLKK